MELGQILSFLEKIAPRSIQESYDNSGLILGNGESEVSKVLVCLDVDHKTMDYAVMQGCHAILSHHPVIFKAIKTLTEDTREGSLLAKAIRNNIALYSCHTNFDSAAGGLTDLVCQRLGLKHINILKKSSLLNNDFGQGRYGEIEKTSGYEFIEMLKKQLAVNVVRVVGTAPEALSKAAVYNGSYDREILGELIALKPDVLVTGDLKYHDAQELVEKGLFTVDAGHYGTEKLFVEELARILENKFPSLSVIQYQGTDVFIYV